MLLKILSLKILSKVNVHHNLTQKVTSNARDLSSVLYKNDLIPLFQMLHFVSRMNEKTLKMKKGDAGMG